MGHALLLRARRSEFRFPTVAPGHPAVRAPGTGDGGLAAVISEPEEIADQVYEQLFGRVCAIDVAKESGKVCTRLPRLGAAGRRVSRVWDVPATTRAVVELADLLVGLGIEKVTVESTSDYWRI